MRILVTGATGFVGNTLIPMLIEHGHEVRVLVRNAVPAHTLFGKTVEVYKWKDHTKEPASEVFSGVNAVINLMGENIAAKRWDDERKKLIYDSRIISTNNLVSAINKHCPNLTAYIGTSAIGIYPVNISDELSEQSPLGDSFLSTVCLDWELASEKLNKDIRRVVLRVGMVLGKNGGALSKMLPIFKWGLGGPIGDGHQYMNWIHIKDLSHLFAQGIEDDTFYGIYNAVSPHPVTNKKFTKVLSKILGMPAFFMIPKFILRLILGEMSTIVVDSQNVVPSQLLKKNHTYFFPKIEEALKDIV